MRRLPATAIYDENDLLPQDHSIPSLKDIFKANKKRPKAYFNRKNYVFDNNAFDLEGESGMRRLPKSATLIYEETEGDIVPVVAEQNYSNPLQSATNKTEFTSDWVKWHQSRRAEIDAKRVPEEVIPENMIKVRQEIAELKSDHLHEEEEHTGGKGRKRRHLQSRKRMKKKLTVNQYLDLVYYWNHDLFVYLRLTGIVVAIIALITHLLGMALPSWTTYQQGNSNMSSGLWALCNSTGDQVSCQYFIPSESRYSGWQYAVLCLVVITFVFSITGIVFAILGVRTINIPKKVYRLHSGGEMFIISGFCELSAVVVYPFSLMNFLKYPNSEYSYAYWLSVGGGAGYLVCATCLLFDEIIRRSVRPLKCVRIARQRRKSRIERKELKRRREALEKERGHMPRKSIIVI